MTTTTDPRAVLQIDREAASAFWNSGKLWTRDGLAQAFARHREQAACEGVEAAGLIAKATPALLTASAKQIANLLRIGAEHQRPRAKDWDTVDYQADGELIVHALATLPKPEQPSPEASEQGEVTQSGTLVNRLEWLSSIYGEHMDDGPRLTEFCKVGRKAATAIRTLEAEVARLVERLAYKHRDVDTMYASATAAEAKLAEARDVVREMVYETTHLSPERLDGSHDCRISGSALANARNFLSPKEPS